MELSWQYKWKNPQMELKGDEILCPNCWEAVRIRLDPDKLSTSRITENGYSLKD